MDIMQNTNPEDQPALRAVMDRYAPEASHAKGLVGDFIKAMARFVGEPPATQPAAETAPTPVVLYQTRNLAGQTVASRSARVVDTFRQMEKTLQKSFATASRGDASLADRQQFVKLAEQVQKDADLLATACFITGGAPSYKFTLEPQPGRHIPLKDAFASVQGAKKAGNDVEFVTFGSGRKVTMMRPVNGFRKTDQKTPVV
jgi:hypothetical protein